MFIGLVYESFLLMWTYHIVPCDMYLFTPKITQVSWTWIHRRGGLFVILSISWLFGPFQFYRYLGSLALSATLAILDRPSHVVLYFQSTNLSYVRSLRLAQEFLIFVGILGFLIRLPFGESIVDCWKVHLFSFGGNSNLNFGLQAYRLLWSLNSWMNFCMYRCDYI